MRRLGARKLRVTHLVSVERSKPRVDLTFDLSEISAVEEGHRTFHLVWPLLASPYARDVA